MRGSGSSWAGRAEEFGPTPDDHEARSAYGGLISSLRSLLDVVAGAAPSAEACRAAAATMSGLTDELAAFEAEEECRYFNRLPEAVGHAQAFTPVFFPDTMDAGGTTGRVVFTRFHLGGGGAAHGGAVALLFDSVLGRLANSSEAAAMFRTVQLDVSYRRITPIGRELAVEATVTRAEGRKLFVTGSLGDGHEVLAEAKGIFVRLLPGQQ